MGNWTMVVEGIGPHDNQDYADDANKLLLNFVKELQSKSHLVYHVSFTAGSRQTANNEPHYDNRTSLK